MESTYQKYFNFQLEDYDSNSTMILDVYYQNIKDNEIYLNDKKYVLYTSSDNLVFFMEHKIYIIDIERHQLSIFTDVLNNFSEYNFVSLICKDDYVSVIIKPKVNSFNNLHIEYRYVLDKKNNPVSKMGELHNLKIYDDNYSILAAKPGFTQQDIDENKYDVTAYYYDFLKQLRLYQKVNNYYKIKQINAFKVNYENKMCLIYNRDSELFLSHRSREIKINEMEIKSLFTAEFNNFFINHNCDNEIIFNLKQLIN